MVFAASRVLFRKRMMDPSVMERLRAVGAMDEVALVQRQFGALSESEARLLCNEIPAEPIRRHFEPRWGTGLSSGARLVDRLLVLATEVNIRLTLANDFLPKVDVASMKESLEVRVPMLDEDLMGFALRIPWWLKVGRKEGKLPLRDVAATLLPADVVQKPKHGFGVPLDLWFPVALKRELAAQMLARSSPLNHVFRKEVFRPWVQAFAAGETVPGLSRSALHLRFMMLLAVFLFLSESEL